MLKLSAFADEISPGNSMSRSGSARRKPGHAFFELRGVRGKNVMDFAAPLCAEIKTKLAENGLGVISIGSPIGRIAIDKPWQEHFEQLQRRQVELAEYFQSPLLRVFSYYPTGGEGKGPVDPHRNEVIDRFLQKVEYLKDRLVTMVHENERGIFGDIGKRCLDLMKSVNSPKLRSAFDFANFVLIGERPMDNWPMLKPYTIHIHVKDANAASSQMVPAGQGDGNIEAILIDAYRSGYRGALTLEPHLKVAGHSHGETGPELFKVAADALKNLCRRNGIALSGAK